MIPPLTSRVDVRAGYRIAIDGSDLRWYFAGDRDGTTEFLIYRLGADGWESTSPLLPRAPIVFETLDAAEDALDRLASRKAFILARKYAIVGPDDTVVVRFTPPLRPKRSPRIEVPSCETCGSKCWRSIADGRIVCRCCGTIEES